MSVGELLQPGFDNVSRSREIKKMEHLPLPEYLRGKDQTTKINLPACFISGHAPQVEHDDRILGICIFEELEESSLLTRPI